MVLVTVMCKYVVVSRLIYGITVDKEKEDAIIENACSLLLDSSNTNRSSGLKALNKTKEPSFIKCYKNPSYASFISTLSDVVFVGVPDNYKKKVSDILTEEYKAKIKSFLQSKHCMPVLPNLKKYNYEPCRFAQYLKYLAFAREWDALFKDYDEKLMYEDFVSYNESYYKVLKNAVKKNDEIIIMDPELWLLPGYFDNIRVSVVFLTPFFKIEFFKCVYNNMEILNSLLKAHLVFQNADEVTSFLELCAINIPNFDEQSVSIQILQVGLDMDYINMIKGNPRMEERVAQIRENYKGKKIILTILNTVNSELSENVLIAFNELLGDTEAVLVQIETHSNQLDVQKRIEISKGVSFITTTRGTDSVLTVTPTNDLEYYSFLAAADLGLFLFDHSVTNKGCCDFVAVNSAPFVLSVNSVNHFTSLLVNPNDSNELLAKMREGLSLGTDAMHSRNKEVLRGMAVSDLAKKMEYRENVAKDKEPKQLEEAKILQAFEKANKRVIVLDYDGTLTEIVPVPSDAAPSAEIISLLEYLTDLKNTTVVIATGRSKDEAEKWFTNPKIQLYAEHSAFYRKKGQWIRRDVDLSWMDVARQIINEYVACTPNTKLEEKNTALVFHYRNADDSYKDEQAERCRKALVQALKGRANVKVGKCIVEANCRDIGKDYVIKQYENCDFGLCAGDDTTDEKMFGRECFVGIVVGKKISKAEYFVEDPKAFRNFLKKLK